ncbi:MAG: MerR family transcriptional regulator [Desulfatibacillum sp.]|nr:MerR family transcriptional regulator [Desulfatibacillum sp.]
MNKEPTDNKPVFTISQLAEQLDISTPTIRFYEQKGLLSPARTPGNQRVYTRKDRARLRLILRGKRFGFSLDEIAEMIGMANMDMDEKDQIEKTMAFGVQKLEEIRIRKEELLLLEKEILAIGQRLQKKLNELQGGK